MDEPEQSPVVTAPVLDEAKSAESGESSAVRFTGRLLEIDYHARRAKLWDADGNTIKFSFDASQEGLVDAARRALVTIEGSTTGKHAQPVRMLSLTVAERAPRRVQTIAEMAAEQGVKPIAAAESLASDAWVDEDVDEFIATVRRWRQGS